MIMRRAALVGVVLVLSAGGALIEARGAHAQPATDAAPASPAGKARRRPKPAPAAEGDPTAAEPAADGKVDAKALVQSGVRLLKQKDYLGALAVFRDAYQRFPSVKLLLNIGTTLKLLGRNAEAANAYQRYLDDPQADPARRAEVADVLSTLDRVLGRLQLAAGPGSPKDASVSVNGGEWLPLAQAAVVRVDPGPYKVAARRDGFTPVEVNGGVGAGEQAVVDLALVAQVVAPADVGSGDLLPRPGAEPLEDQSGVHARAGAQQPRSRFGLMLRGHFHVTEPAGAAALVGPTMDVTSRIEVNIGALVGRFRGGYLGGSFAILPGRLRPLAAAGVLLVVDDGPRFAARGALGLEVSVSRNLSVFVEVGGEHVFDAPMTVFANAFVPSAGVYGRL